MAIKPNYYIHRSRTLAVKCLEKAKNVQIRVGMTREELERYYHHDGGIYFLDDEPYVFRCDTKGITAVKISVAFDRVSPPTDNKLDRIEKVAGPGIGESHAD